MARVVQDCVGGLTRQLLPSMRSWCLPPESRFSSFGDPRSSPAEQDARANVPIGHAACYRLYFRIEAFESESLCRTQRARCGRGSSLTLGKNENP